jgi:hypothetical protein
MSTKYYDETEENEMSLITLIRHSADTVLIHISYNLNNFRTVQLIIFSLTFRRSKPLFRYYVFR